MSRNDKKDDYTSWKEYRRHLGIKMLGEGKKQTEVAAFLEVAPSTVSTWAKHYIEDPEHGLETKKQTGAPAKIGDEKLALCFQVLFEFGPEMLGFEGERWTTGRISSVIEDWTGVHYHPSHISLLLRQFGYSVQQPVCRAEKRDEAAIQAWQEKEWPEIKKRIAQIRS